MPVRYNPYRNTYEDTLIAADTSVTPAASKVPLADGSGKLAAGWLTEVLALADLSDVSAKSGSGSTVLMQDSPTITTPTIASLTNAQHSHQNAAGGGTLDAAAIAAGTFATARLGSGAAGVTTFLRGDSSWAATAASESSANMVFRHERFR